MEKERVLIGFDFSVNKPACCIVFRNEIHFMFWPLSLSKNEEKAYNETDVYVFNRNLSSISKKSNLTASQMVREHTERSRNLAGFIVEDLNRMFYRWYNVSIGEVDMYVATEGLSFGSSGNSALDLATYKGVFLASLIDEWPDVVLETYAPISIKSVAGCSKKAVSGEKEPMIEAFLREDKIKCLFRDMLRDGKLRAKTNYIHGVDDIVDSYWTVKTLYKKSGMNDIDILE